MIMKRRHHYSNPKPDGPDQYNNLPQHDEPSKSFIFSSPKRVFTLCLIFRMVNALLIRTYFNPDEHWQALEVAHRIAFGYGHLTWEWSKGIRSYLHPMVFVLLYKALAFFRLDTPLFMVYNLRRSPPSHGMGAKKIWNGMEVAEEAREDIPSSPLTIDISHPLPQITPMIINLCKELFKKWSELDDSCFSVETVSGGTTNLLLKVSVREEDGNLALLTVRLFGPNTEFVIDRERELMAIGHLSDAGFGAKLLGAFGNGMVQSFINARTLSPEDMRVPKLAADIARQLRSFHEVEIPGCREPQLWKDMSKFLEKASALKFDDCEKQRRYEKISFEELHDAVSQLKDLTDLLNAPVVFAHNDLLSGNLMLNDDEEKLYFIDFEYGSYSYRGYDIANHFNEYAGFDCDYTLYPDKDSQYHFFRHYLQPDEPQEVSEADLEKLYVETNSYKLASHLYWALWALIQANVSSIDFDYLGYFFLRYEEYKKKKADSIALAQSFLSTSRVTLS